MRNSLTWLGIGALVGGLMVWALTLGWLSRERAGLTRWADSTETVYRAQVDLIDRDRLAALTRAESDRLTRVAAEAQADRERDARLAGDRDRARLRASLAAATTAGDSLPLLVAVVQSQDSQVVQLVAETGQLRDALRAEVRRSAALVQLVAVGDSGIAIRDRRIASQDSVIRARLVPSVSRGTLFGLPLPSRTVTFIAGVVIGALVSR